MAKKITRRKCIATIAAAILPRPLIAQQTPLPIIGILDSAAATAVKLSAFYEGLKVEGFSRNQNLTVEYHSAEGDYARLPELAADLVDRRVTLITAFGSPAALTAKAATTKIPIVFAVSANPTEIGLVTSLNHPGANVTGVTGMAVGREHKRLELLHAAVPTAPVLGFLLNPQNSSRDVQINDALASAQKVGVQIKIIRPSTGRDFSNVFAELTQSQAGGLVVADDEFFLSASVDLGSSAARHRFPAIFQGTAFTAAGGLMSYGTRLTELYHQAGAYSGLVLARAAPADLPIYQSTAVEMIVNLRSAKSIGIALPQSIVDQATTLIK
jgi:putative tryptophan/tyrosine transport system substrate-binding protein